MRFKKILVLTIGLIASFALLSCNNAKASPINEKTVIGGAESPSEMLTTETTARIAYIKNGNLCVQDIKADSKPKICKIGSKTLQHPIISQNKTKVAVKDKNNLIIYDIQKDSRKSVYAKNINEFVWSNDKIVFTVDNQKGFNIYDIKSGKISHIDSKFEYYTLTSGKDDIIYASAYGKDGGIFEIKTSAKSTKRIIENKDFEQSSYSPQVLKYDPSENRLFIIERAASGSLSSDLVGLGIYDVTTKKHEDLIQMKKNLEKSGTSTENKKIEGIKVLEGMLKYKENMDFAYFTSLIAINQGDGRDMLVNKKVVLYDIKSKKATRISPENMVTQTPSLSFEGGYVYYSAQKEIANFSDDSYKNMYKNKSAIYRYNVRDRKTDLLTKDDSFNIAPLSIGSGKLVFLRINKDSKIFENVKASLILLENDKEQKIADNILLYDAKNKVGTSYYGYVSNEDMTTIF
ncbi:putative lipoprotein [Peptostreptococcaceae bacterium AS15]|nr:putative lipoprotein [Peptostreptococcaceae bacterium AS15]